MTTTPVPPHLSDEERALWEKATRAHTGEWYGEGERIEPTPLGSYANFIAACPPLLILSLLTALSTERDAGERDKARLDWLSRRMESCDDGVYAWGIIGLNPSIPSLRDAIDTASENDHA